MARNNQRGGTTSRRTPKDLGRRVKKKPCALCRDKVEWVDYKDVHMLRKYMSDRGKIRSRRVTGNCAQHQRALAQAIKTARELVLLPYTQRTVTERPGGRGGGRDGGRDRGDRFGGDGPGGEGGRRGGGGAPGRNGPDGGSGGGRTDADQGDAGVETLEDVQALAVEGLAGADADVAEVGLPGDDMGTDA